MRLWLVFVEDQLMLVGTKKLRNEPLSPKTPIQCDKNFTTTVNRIPPKLATTRTLQQHHPSGTLSRNHVTNLKLES